MLQKLRLPNIEKAARILTEVNSNNRLNNNKITDNTKSRISVNHHSLV
jgi:hypothetical protein